MSLSLAEAPLLPLLIRPSSSGAYNSSERFTKAAMLKQPATIWNWTTGMIIGPQFVAPGLPSTNPNLMTNMIMMHNLWLPKGIDDAGGIQGAGMNAERDISLWATLRDHANRVMYYTVRADDREIE